jgi:hypothetical protein
MEQKIVALSAHRVLLTAAGVVGLSGLFTLGTTTVAAAPSGCQNGAVCWVQAGQEMIKGHCNYDVDNEVCCCDALAGCPEHDNCGS